MTSSSDEPPSPADGAPQPDQYYSIPTVAKLLCVSERHVWRMVAGGALRARDLGGATRISGSDLIELQRRSLRPKRNLPKLRKTPGNSE